MMMFALLFTVGTAYFLVINSDNGLNNQAAISAQSAAGQTAGERVSLSLSVCGATGTWCNTNQGSLGISAFNSGGVAATIVAVFAKNSLGQNAIISPAPQYLTGSANLNLTLPLSLSVGASTGSMTGCGAAGSCSIGIPLTVFDPSVYTLATPATISVLTKAGNVFSTQYPPAPLTTTTTVSTTNTVSNTITTTTGGPGGNTLVIQMVATPSQVFSGATVTLTITVYNYALQAVTSVTLSPAPPTATVSGTASLTGGSCAPASYPSIAAYSGSGNAPFVTFTCTYTAHTGAVGGFATFSGSAQAVSNGNGISSAQEISNTVQIGGTNNVTTQGAFSINFFFWKYSSCTNAPPYASACTVNPNPMPPASPNNLPTGATISGGGNKYVAFYIQVTNNFNTTLAILDYSLLQLDGSNANEADWFLVGVAATPQSSVTYYPNYCPGAGVGCTNHIPALTAYTGNEISCAGSPPPATCIDVMPGETVTLAFAACGYGSSSWEWAGANRGSSYDGGSSGCATSTPSFGSSGSAAAVITTLVYIYKGQVYTQDIAFQGVTVLP